MADLTLISSLATAAGTLVLAVATFSSVRSANRTARVAERSLLEGIRPVLIPSREDDLDERVIFGDGHWVTVHGHGAVLELADDNLYMAMGLRNAGAGIAVLHGWRAEPYEPGAPLQRSDPERFRRQQLDLYIPTADTGFWQGAIRDDADESYSALRAAAEHGERISIELLYGDHEGGQRAIVRFGVTLEQDGHGRRANVIRYWNLDRQDPR